MATLVFDIETSCVSKDNLDESQLEYLCRPAENLEDETEREKKREQIERMFNLWPFTAQVVCIAMLNADSGRGKVYFASDDAGDSGEADGYEYVACLDEFEVLTSFWEAARKFNRIVTFNGRAFDVPFLYLRSAGLNVPISQKNWLGYRFSTEPHCDLADQLCFYGVSGRDGAARRFNMDFYCRAFGITSPKSQGVSGQDVNDLMGEGKYREIAEYCARDVIATNELYQMWKERLAGVK